MSKLSEAARLMAKRSNHTITEAQKKARADNLFKARAARLRQLADIKKRKLLKANER